MYQADPQLRQFQLTARNKGNLDRVLTSAEADPFITDDRWLAYMLATFLAETPIFVTEGRKKVRVIFEAVRELGKGKGRDYGKPVQVWDPHLGKHVNNVYYGRGLVQLTWLENYIRMNAEIRKYYPDVIADFEARTGQIFDLVLYPDQALDWKIAWTVASLGMRLGAFAKDPKFKQPARFELYFPKTGPSDPVRARRMINGTDRNDEIAEYYQAFLPILKASRIVGVVGPAVQPASAALVPVTAAPLMPVPEPEAALEATEVVPGVETPTIVTEMASGASMKQDINVEAQAPVVSAPGDEVIYASRGGKISRIATFLGSVGVSLQMVWGWFKDNADSIFWGGFFLTVIICVFMFRQVLLDWLRMKLAADPTKHTVR